VAVTQIKKETEFEGYDAVIFGSPTLSWGYDADHEDLSLQGKQL
jgi:hypothetical protein